MQIGRLCLQFSYLPGNAYPEALPPIFLFKREAEPLDISRRSLEVSVSFYGFNC